jgi:serine protease Do
VGDTILEVNNQAVKSVEDFEKAVQGVKDSGRSTALVKAQRDGNTRFIGLPISESNS